MFNRIKKTIKTGCLLLGAGFALATLDVKAGMSYQTDTNTLAAFSTNTFKLYGDVTGSYTNGEQSSGFSYIDATKGDDLFLQYGGFFTNSGAGPSNIVFKVAQTVDFANWTNNAVSLTLSVPVGTNWVHGQTLIQNAYPGYGLRSVENPNTGNVSAAPGTTYLKGYIKNGI